MSNRFNISAQCESSGWTSSLSFCLNLANAICLPPLQIGRLLFQSIVGLQWLSQTDILPLLMQTSCVLQPFYADLSHRSVSSERLSHCSVTAPSSDVLSSSPVRHRLTVFSSSKGPNHILSTVINSLIRILKAGLCSHRKWDFDFLSVVLVLPLIQTKCVLQW